MAALMLQVPQETARVLHEVPVPGNPEREDPHITMLYLGKDLPVERIGEMLPVIYGVTSSTLPFSVSTSHISNFPGNDDGVPVIAKIDSPDLHRFHAALCDAFDEAEIFYDKKFPIYKPHTTLAYAPDPETKVDIDIPEISWGAHELVLWGSNHGTGRLVVKFPLSLPMAKVARASDPMSDLYRAAVRLSLWSERNQFA